MRTPGPRAVLSVALVVAILSYAAYLAVSTPGTVRLVSPPSRFTVNGRTFSITYIAADQGSRQAGLMNKKITNSTTMLFVFPSPGTYSFWMSHVNSTLDIIWLNVTGDAGTVVYVVRDAPGCNSSVVCPIYQPPSPANWVIEAKGGFSVAYGVDVGTSFEFA